MRARNRAGRLRVLEVGCGTGKWLAELASAGCGVAGVDPSAEMLRRAAAEVKGSLCRGSAESLPCRSASFDAVFYVNAFHHFATPESALGETFRVLRPGGKLLSIGLDPHEGTGPWYVYEFFPETLALDLARFPSRARRTRWMEAAGFRNIDVRVAERRIPTTYELSFDRRLAGLQRASTRTPSAQPVERPERFEPGFLGAALPPARRPRPPALTVAAGHSGAPSCATRRR